LDRHAGIVILASIVIAASVGYSSFSAVTLDQIQIKWNDRGSFGFITMLNGGMIEVCNSSFVPLSFNQISIVAFLDGEEAGRFTAGGTTVQPGSSAELRGDGEMTGSAAGMFSTYIDTETPGNNIARVDSSSIAVLTSIDTAVLGMIPFSVTEWYSGQEFFEMMNEKSEGYGC